MSDATERWLPVVGYEGLYEVSDHGRVRSLDRVVMRRGGLAAGRPMRCRGRILSATRQSRREHLKVGLCDRESRQVTFAVHTLVLSAFVGPAPAGTEGCHYDGDPTNNHVPNLRWDTRSGNVRDAVRLGTHNETRKVSCPHGHALVAPNLRSSQMDRGHRQCLACHRASAAGQKAKRSSSAFDMQAVSDQRYADIMGSGIAA